MTRFPTLLAFMAVLAACASNREAAPVETGDRAPTMDQEVEVVIVGDGSLPIGEGRLLCYPDVDPAEGPEELAQRLDRTSLRIVDDRGSATIPADTSTAFFLGAEAIWPAEWNTGPISTRAGVAVLRLVQSVRFAHMTVVDENGRPIEATARPVTDGEFPRSIPFGELAEKGRVSDLEGRILLASAWWPDRSLWVQVSAPGRAPRCVALRTTTPGHEQGNIAPRIVLERRRDAQTFAVDDRTGRLVKPDLVRFRPGPPEGDRVPEGHQLIAVGEDGRFNLPLGSRRPFRLEVLAEGFEPWIDEAVRIETMEIRLKPRP